MVKIGSVHPRAMSEEQLSALLAKLKEDARLREKLKAAADMDAFVKIAKDAGLEVNNDDWIRYKQETAALDDSELESIAGGAQISNHNETWCTKCGTGYNELCCGKA